MQREHKPIRIKITIETLAAGNRVSSFFLITSKETETPNPETLASQTVHSTR